VPVWLDAEGKKIWKAGKALLAPRGLLTPLDEMAFARYCALLASWRRLERFRQEHGETYTVRDAAGKLTGLALYPQVTLQLRLSEQLLKLEQSFGLTPASRAHLDVKEPETPPHGNSRVAKDKARFFRLPGQEGY
jgi:P27 family predicted phage terminase small subunit